MLLKHQSKGFTIIEVLIVLVIAAVIMLIVFLAVPALQRNSRNNARRNDVSRLLSALVEAGNNRNWQDVYGWGGVFIAIDAAENVGELNIYQDETIGGSLKYGSPPGSADPSADNATIIMGAICDGETTAEAKNRSVAVLYRVENATDSTVQCDSA